jgi:hypothetical protein
MKTYSPFNKPIQDVVTADLDNLKEVAEGWYIEYKEEEPKKALALAKSLSAFANTYGGWLFLGVREGSKDDPVASEFPGIPRTEVDALLQRMRKSATDHLHPTPHFETSVLWGPDTNIGLAENHAIICVWIPMSQSAPHIHKSGHIYRRVADASEPKPENDRFVLDQLWKRGEGIKRQHKEWYERDPEFSEGETDQPYVRVMIAADLWDERDIWIDDGDKVKEILQTSSSLPFDTVYTSANGFIGRQLEGNDLQNLSLTWRVRQNLVSDVIIPLPLYKSESRELLAANLEGYIYVDKFLDVLGKYQSSAPKIVDLNYLFNVLCGVAKIQEQLCKLAGWAGNYHVKAKLLNVWRTIPYVDVQEVIHRFSKYGPPMCLDTIASLPRGTGPDNYIEIQRHYPEIEDDQAKVFIQALRLFEPIALSFGIPAWIDSPEGAEPPYYHQSLMQAGGRAMQRQHRRNNN